MTIERRLEAREAISAYVDEQGFICLRQEDTTGNDDAVIILNPSDVPTVIAWLQELLDEVKNKG